MKQNINFLCQLFLNVNFVENTNEKEKTKKKNT